MRISDEEADLIRASFRALNVDPPRAAEAFYRHLFEIDPASRDLFVADMARQGVKMMSTLGVVVAQIQAWELLAETVEDLAIRHLAYGVRPEHYASVAAALQAMFEERLHDAYTPATAAAWAKAYAGLSSAMIAAAYPVVREVGTDP